MRRMYELEYLIHKYNNIRIGSPCRERLEKMIKTMMIGYLIYDKG